MAISECDACGNVRPGSSRTDSCGCEGFFCHLCCGDELDPYCEIEDEIEVIEAKLAKAIRNAETGKDWADIAKAEEEFLAPLLALRMEAAAAEKEQSKARTAEAMRMVDETIAMIRQVVEAV